MKKLLLGSIAVVTLVAGPHPAVANWTGCYVGVNAGYQWGAGSAALALQPSLAAWTVLDPAYAVFAGQYASSPSSGLVGGQAGCNLQLPTVVLGIEADLDFLGASNTTNRTGMAQGLPALASVTQNLNWLGTARGRLGVIIPSTNWLIYATGGLAFGQTSFSHLFVRTDTNPDIGFAGSASQIKIGWTLGAGAEFMISSHWSVKGEYLYYDLGCTSVFGAPFNQVANGYGADGIYQTKGHILRVGLNFR